MNNTLPKKCWYFHVFYFLLWNYLYSKAQCNVMLWQCLWPIVKMEWKRQVGALSQSMYRSSTGSKMTFFRGSIGQQVVPLYGLIHHVRSCLGVQHIQRKCTQDRSNSIPCLWKPIVKCEGKRLCNNVNNLTATMYEVQSPTIKQGCTSVNNAAHEMDSLCQYCNIKWQRVYLIRQFYPHIGKNHSPTVVFVSLFFSLTQIFIAPGLQNALIMFSNGLRLNRAVAGYLEWE